MSKRDLFQTMVWMVVILGPVGLGLTYFANQSSGRRQPREKDDSFQMRCGIGVGLIVLAILLEVYVL